MVTEKPTIFSNSLRKPPILMLDFHNFYASDEKSSTKFKVGSCNKTAMTKYFK